MRREGKGLRVTFDHTDGGLKLAGNEFVGFEIAGPDHKFHWANAMISGADVVLSSPDVEQPIAVRYAWDANPVAPLMNGAGLPAVPFRAGGLHPACVAAAFNLCLRSVQ